MPRSLPASTRRIPHGPTSSVNQCHRYRIGGQRPFRALPSPRAIQSPNRTARGLYPSRRTETVRSHPVHPHHGYIRITAAAHLQPVAIAQINHPPVGMSLNRPRLRGEQKRWLGTSTQRDKQPQYDKEAFHV